MKVQVEYRDLLNAVKPLEGALSKKVPVRVGLQMREITQQINAKLEVFQNSRDALMAEYREYETEDENGQRTLPSEKGQELDEKFNELLDTDTEIDIPLLKPEALDEVGFTIAEVMNLHFIFKD